MPVLQLPSPYFLLSDGTEYSLQADRGLTVEQFALVLNLRWSPEVVIATAAEGSNNIKVLAGGLLLRSSLNNSIGAKVEDRPQLPFQNPPKPYRSRDDIH
jgi:hypothetical protein